jgi:hypothetical protein
MQSQQRTNNSPKTTLAATGSDFNSMQEFKEGREEYKSTSLQLTYKRMDPAFQKLQKTKGASSH